MQYIVFKMYANNTAATNKNAFSKYLRFIPENILI